MLRGRPSRIGLGSAEKQLPHEGVAASERGDGPVVVNQGRRCALTQMLQFIRLRLSPLGTYPVPFHKMYWYFVDVA